MSGPLASSRGASRLRRGVPSVGGYGGPFLRPPLRTGRLVARADLELGGRQAQRLIHVIDLPEHLVVQVALRVLHYLGDEGGAVARAALRIGDRVETGTWFMNRCDYLDPALAWTGVKDSGRGCTLSRLGLETFTRPKSFHLRLKT